MNPLTITIPGVPPSVNLGRSQHWSKVAGSTEQFRSLASVCTKNAVMDWGEPLLPWVGGRPLRLVVWHYPDTLRGDAHNREKAVVDGIVDGLNNAMEYRGEHSPKLFNDSHIAICSMHPVRDKENPRVVCRLVPEDWFAFCFGRTRCYWRSKKETPAAE